jgi:hypothetical protein
MQVMVGGSYIKPKTNFKIRCICTEWTIQITKYKYALKSNFAALSVSFVKDGTLLGKKKYLETKYWEKC